MHRDRLRNLSPWLLLAAVLLAVLLAVLFIVFREATPKPGTGSAAGDERRAPAEAPRVVSSISLHVAAPELRSGGANGNGNPAASQDAAPESEGLKYVRKGIQWAFGNHSPNPAWSFDGNRIAFHDGLCISIVDSNGNLVQTLRPDAEVFGCNSPRWSHDGTRIAGSSVFHQPGRLFDAKRAAIKGFSTGRNDEFAGGLWSLSFSPDDRYLIGRIHQHGVVLVPLDDHHLPASLVSEQAPDEAGFFPSLSPSGARAIRLLNEFDDRTGRLEILDVSDAPDAIRMPEGADGANRSGGADESVAPRIMAKRIALVETERPIMEIEWSPDSRTLVAVMTPRWYDGYDTYLYPQGLLLLIDTQSGAARRTMAYGRNPAWSPDGNYIAFDKPGGGIWLMGAAGDQPPWRLYPQGVEPRWAPTGERMFILDPERGRAEILTLSRRPS